MNAAEATAVESETLALLDQPNALPSVGRVRWQRLVAAGFAPPPVSERDIAIKFNFVPLRTGLPIVGVFLPTMIERALQPENADFLNNVAEQLLAAVVGNRAQLHLYLGMQYGPGETVIAAHLVEDAVNRLRSALGSQQGAIGLTALSLRGPGKVISINAMTAEAARHGVETAILIDDDVAFSPNCFARLIDAHLDGGGRTALGARKVGAPFNTRASSILHTLKSFTQPAENYPHACCMLVPLDVIAPEIPPIYSSDDGYICFRLLDAAAEDPLRRLKLVEDARCYHLVGGRSSREIRARIRRMLLHHHLFLSHGTPANARFYLAELLFFGMWPWVRFDVSQGAPRGLVKCLLKYLYAIWFGKIGLELILRGLAGRPLQTISWGSA